MKKRVASFVMAFVMVFTLLGAAVPAHAASGTALKMKADKTQVEAGDTVTYTFTLDAVEDMRSMKFKLAIPEGLTYVQGSGKVAQGLAEAMNAIDVDFTEQSMVFTFAGKTAYTSSKATKLMTLQCTVDEDATGELTLDLAKAIECNNNDNGAIPCSVTKATVTVKKAVQPEPEVPEVNETALTLKANKTTAKPGEIITFTATLDAVKDMRSLKFKLAVPQGLTYVAGTGKVTEGLAEDMNAIDVDFTEQSMVFTFAGKTAYTSSKATKLMTLQCTVDEDANGKLTLDLAKAIECNDKDNGAITCPVTPATVNVKGVTPPVIGEATVTFRVVNGTWSDNTTADKTVTVETTDGKGTLAKSDIPTGMKANEGYENGAWNKTPSTTVTGNVTYTYTFEKHVPTKDIAKVTFRVKNGTWAEGGNKTKTVNVELLDGVGTLNAKDVPTGMKANKGYENGAWNKTPNTNPNGITGDVTYTYTFQKHEAVKTETTVTFKVVNGTWKDGKTADKTVKVTLWDGVGTLDKDDVPTGMKPNKGYKNGAWDKTPNTRDDAVTGPVTYTYTFEKHVPVISEAKVTFKVVNGTWDGKNAADKVVKVTLTDGEGTLDAKDVPTGMKANEGYKNGKWNKTPNTRENGITGDVTYTYNFSKESEGGGGGGGGAGGGSSVTPVKPSTGFTDVAADSVYAPAIKWAVENGITNGLTPTTFGPNVGCTRAQAVTFLWRAAGSPAPKTAGNPFVDVASDSVYAPAIRWAVEKGITKGVTATTFEPNATCTRAQIVTFQWRAAGYPAVGLQNNFTDVDANAFYASAVNWAVQNGITTGVTATTFEPDATCTRAQIVTFLYRAQ